MTIALWLARDLSDSDDAGRRHDFGTPSKAIGKTTDGSSVSEAECALVERVRAGDVAAFESLSQQHSDALWRYAYRFVRTDDLAADVVQDVLFHLWQHRECLDSQQNVRAYLFKDTRFRALNLLRHHRIVHRYESTHDPISVSGTSQDLQASSSPTAESDLHLALERILGTIPAHRREILLLRWKHGFAYEEIAEILGLGVSAVKMQIHRAAAQLRPLLERTFLDR